MLAFIRNHKAGVVVGAVAATGVLAWLAFGFFGVHTLFVDDVVDEGGPVFDATPAAVVEAAEPADAASTSATPDEAVVTDGAGAPPAEPAESDTAATDAETETETAAETSADGDPAVATPAETTATTPPAPQIVAEFAGTFVSEDHPTSGSATVLGNGTGQRFLRFENFGTDNGPDLNVYLFDDETGDFVDLGDLKGNIGDQNYEIPEDVDLDRFDRVSIWCVRFGVGFGSAVLTAT